MNRIRLAIASAVLLLSPSLLHAQDEEVRIRPKIMFGPKIGMNISKLNGNNWDGGYRTNLLGGLFLGVRGKHLGLQIEGLFSQSSYTTGTGFNNIYHQYLNSVSDSVKKGSFKVSYFNIPVLLQLKLMNRVWIQAGPQYSGVVSVKDVNSLYKDATKLFSDGAVSGVVGLWINLPAHLNIGGRYIFGLSHFNADAISESWKQRDIQVHLGFSF